MGFLGRATVALIGFLVFAFANGALAVAVLDPMIGTGWTEFYKTAMLVMVALGLSLWVAELAPSIVQALIVGIGWAGSAAIAQAYIIEPLVEMTLADFVDSYRLWAARYWWPVLLSLILAPPVWRFLRGSPSQA